jgi:redox-sensitive bicupin YhaK (pirin superfamily)
MSDSITHVVKPRLTDLGGFSVRRMLPSLPIRMVGPFIFFDHFGPASFPPSEGMDVRPHPHIGLATVTYLFEGAILHRDSLGSDQLIRPGDVNWMTAGKGIVHSERTPPDIRATGSPIHGLQTWVALPRDFEETTPSFFHHAAATLPVIEERDHRLRVVAGSAFGARSPVQTFSDTLYVAVELNRGGNLTIPPEHEERAIYVVEGGVMIDDETLGPTQLAVLAAGVEARVTATTPAKLMLLGGARMDGYRYIWWNFVSSSKERIEQAKSDWREQRLGRVPGETEFIPLPEK